MATTKLSELALITVGYPPLKNLSLMNPKDDLYTVYQNPMCPDPPQRLRYYHPIPETALSAEGDILVHVKDLREVLLIDWEHAGQVIPDCYLRIRCNRKRILPEYLQFVLRGDIDSRRKVCRGVALPQQKAKQYGDLKVNLPPLETQEAICSLRQALMAAFADENKNN